MMPAAVALLWEITAEGRPGVSWVCAGELGGAAKNLRQIARKKTETNTEPEARQ